MDLVLDRVERACRELAICGRQLISALEVAVGKASGNLKEIRQPMGA